MDDFYTANVCLVVKAKQGVSVVISTTNSVIDYFSVSSTQDFSNISTDESKTLLFIQTVDTLQAEVMQQPHANVRVNSLAANEMNEASQTLFESSDNDLTAVVQDISQTSVQRLDNMDTFVDVDCEIKKDPDQQLPLDILSEENQMSVSAVMNNINLPEGLPNVVPSRRISEFVAPINSSNDSSLKVEHNISDFTGYLESNCDLEKEEEHNEKHNVGIQSKKVKTSQKRNVRIQSNKVKNNQNRNLGIQSKKVKKHQTRNCVTGSCFTSSSLTTVSDKNNKVTRKLKGSMKAVNKSIVSKKKMKNSSNDNKVGSFCCTWPLCGSAFKSTAKLMAHVKTHTGLKLENEETSNRSYSSEWLNEQSINTSDNGRSQNGQNMKVIESRARNKLPFQCMWPHCEQPFQTHEELVTHSKNHKGEEDLTTKTHCKSVSIIKTTFECPLCDRVCTLKGTLKVHLNRMHKNDINLENELKKLEKNTWLCDICAKSFDRPSSLRYHMESIHDNETVKCDQCDVICQNKRKLSLHNQHVHGPCERKVCDICGMSLMKYSLKKHIRTVHEKSTVVFCKVPGCNQKCSNRKTLKVHTKRHTGDKSLKCDHCEFAAIQRSSMNYHMRKHHPDFCALKNKKP